MDDAFQSYEPLTIPIILTLLTGFTSYVES
jgi:hypothetical protein